MGGISLQSLNITGTETASSGTGYIGYSYGGGLYLNNTSSTQPTTITGLIINNAKATGGYHSRGGGLYIGPSALGSPAASQLTTISGLAITTASATGGAYQSDGGGAYISLNGGFSLEGANTITGTETVNGGGGLYLTNSSSTETTSVTGLTINTAKAAGTGSVYGGGAYINVMGGLTLQSLKIEGPETTGSGTSSSIHSYGGGLYLNNTSSTQPTTITGLTINNAKATGGYYYSRGGGAYIAVNGGLSFEGTNTIKGTETVNGGGGLYLTNSSTTETTSVTGLTINNARATGTSSNGGGAYISSRRLTMNTINIMNTEAATRGGGLCIVNSLAEATAITGLTITNAKTTSDSGGWLGGGGAYIEVGGTLTLQNINITGCVSAGYGGGLLLYNPTTATIEARISNFTIVATANGYSNWGSAILARANAPGHLHVYITDGDYSSCNGSDRLYGDNATFH
jgi:hypothetical protein